MKEFMIQLSQQDNQSGLCQLEYNNQQIFQVKLHRYVNSDIELSKVKQNVHCKMSNHSFRHLIYGPSIGENTFNKFLQLTQRGLIYATRCLKGPSHNFIKTKMQVLPEARIPKAKTLLLDLDETLIHSCSAREKYQTCILAISDQGEEARIYLNVRPFCQWFLQQMSLLYTIYVYTASSSAYASTIVKYCLFKKVFKIIIQNINWLLFNIEFQQNGKLRQF